MNHMSETALNSTSTIDHTLFAPTSATVRYAPGNTVLLIGPSELLLKHLEAYRVAGLRPALLCTDLPDASCLPRGLRALPGRLAGLSGWMGAFTAHMATLQQPMSLAPLSFNEDGHFDWVLDFSSPSSVRLAVPPLGYYALSPDDFPALKRVLLEIAGRVRSGYEKPRYFELDANRCAHRRQSVEGCSACLSVCAAGAISSAKDSVRIEPNLCQGCGSCALVCPSGAVRYTQPKAGFSLTRLQAMLAAWKATGSWPVGLWIFDETTESEPPQGWLPYPVAEMAGLGLEFWLAALAMGLDEVAIVARKLPDETRVALQAQITLAQALLAGMGLRQIISWGEDIKTGLDHQKPLESARPCAELPVTDDKRQLLFAAIDALLGLVETPPLSIPLPAGPLGEIRIDPALCTLCTACVQICPAAALSLPDNPTQLTFTEARCVQCGICANACPEQAITLMPRLLASRSARQAPRVVAEAEMFACCGCGKPFATKSQIERSRALMAGHPMFQGNQARLMELCPECRQRAMAGVGI
ncbi:MAG: 4Fe-4S dicluster domain-containing protein [Thiobacillus sp.]|nr:4Fe-4S dicluster domain-containing protein [Thiobacillus sp.]